MAIKAAELQVVIGADTNPAVQGINSAMGLIRQSASMGLGVFVGNIMTQALGSLRNLAVEGLNAVGSFERLELTLGTLVKRDLANMGESMDLVGQQTQELIQWVQQLAKESPFDASGVTAALRTAMAYGFTADEAKRLTQATIDYAAGSGQTTEVMNQIALALGQIQAKGKLAGQEMLQLTNAGINVRDALAKYLGITVDEVMQKLEDGAIDAQTAIEAVVTTLERDFGGAAKEQATNVSGLISTLGELKQLGLRGLFQGIAEALKPLVVATIEWIEAVGLEKLRALGTVIGTVVAKFVDLAMALARSGAFGKEFSSALGAISPKAREIWDAISPLVQQGLAWLTAHAAEVKAALLGMAVAFGALAVVGTVAGLISALANPLTLILALVGVLSAAWAGNWGGIRDKVQAAWAVIQPIFAQIGEWLSAGITSYLATAQAFWGAVWQNIQRAVQAVFPVIMSVWQAFKAAFQGDWYSFGANLRQAWDQYWALIKTTFAQAWQTIKTSAVAMFRDVVTAIRSVNWAEVGKSIIQGIINGLTSMGGAVKTAATGVARAVVDAIKGFLGIKSPAKALIEVGKNIVLGMIEGLKQAISDVSSIIKAISDLFGKFDWLGVGRRLVSSVSSGITGAVSQVTSAMTQLTTRAANVVTSYAWSNVGKLIATNIGIGVRNNTSLVSSAVQAATTPTRINYTAWYNVGKAIIVQIAKAIKENGGLVSTAISSVLSQALTAAYQTIASTAPGSTSPTALAMTPLGVGGIAGGNVINVTVQAEVSNNVDIETLAYRVAKRLEQYL